MNRRKFIGILSAFSFIATTNSLAQAPKIGIKIGYLPVTDHLMMIAKESFVGSSFTIVGVKFSSWADIAEALRAGAVDGAFLLAPLGLALKSMGADIKVVLSAHKNGSAVIVNEKIADINALDGKKVAIPSRFSSHYFLLDKLAKKHKLKLNLIDMAPPEMPSALKTGVIDGFIVAEPFGQLGLNLGGAKVLAYSREILPNHICCTLNLNSSLALSSVGKELVNGFKQASKLIIEDESLASVLANKVLGQKTSVIKQVLEQNIATYDDLSLSKESLEELKNFLIEKNLGSKNLANLDIDEYLVAL
ncbi:ABC transporter substrate-binding protein [Campylobacter geochelonis]|uniref:ABC transporter substrate-binding protein n=1 Tax=Campylobacter geochelonis TaxID=1780362 RepID=UPI0007709786|nr:ABC transporter substrate-binding protein [Campylobacter geochelonis]CZE51566.1 twin-arginine translocation pathway signal [Campylobacter geochelonis]